MRLAVKTALLCGTGAFLIATYTSMVKTLSPESLQVVMEDPEVLKSLFDPMAIMGIAVPGALIVGAIGYFLGDILSKPADAGKQKNKRKKRRSSLGSDEELSLSNEEVFLDDIEELEAIPLPDSTEPVEAQDIEPIEEK